MLTQFGAYRLCGLSWEPLASRVVSMENVDSEFQTRNLEHSAFECGLKKPSANAAAGRGAMLEGKWWYNEVLSEWIREAVAPLYCSVMRARSVGGGLWDIKCRELLCLDF